MRRSPLKRKKAKRPMSAGDYNALKQAVKERDGGICIGITAGISHACTPPHDAEHLVEQRDIRKTTHASEALADPRLSAYCCRGLNHSLHSYSWLRLATDFGRSDITNVDADRRARASIRRHAPKGFEDAVSEYGLELAADKKLGERDA